MATIKPNDNAPAEGVLYSFAGLPAKGVTLRSGDTHETDDREALANAEAHPWLSVEYPKAEELSATSIDRSVPYKEDALAAVNSKAFDPAQIRKDAPDDAEFVSTAIESGLDQEKVKTAGDVNLTVAADEKATEAAEAAEAEDTNDSGTKSRAKRSS